MEWQSKYRFVIREIVAERWRNSELAMQIVSLIHKYHPTNCVVERTGQWEALQESIQKAAMMRSMVLPHIYFKPAVLAGSSQLGKASRVKNLQDPIARDVVWFQKMTSSTRSASGIWSIFRTMTLRFQSSSRRR
jgi:hypothetical protein